MHINGSLARLKKAITQDFILTSQSYATNAFVDSVWSTVFRNDLHSVRNVIFVGYSLYDIDVSRLLFNPGLIFEKTHFIDKNEIDPVLEIRLSKFGRVHSIGVEGFAAIIDQEKANWIQPKFVEHYRNWKQVRATTTHEEPADEDVYNLVLQGLVQEGLLLSQCDRPQVASYTVVRECEAACLQHLAQPNAVALLVGAFANGKTVTVQSLSLQLAASGREIFALDRPTDTAATELRGLCQRDGKFVVVIENYSRNLELVETFCRYAGEGCSLLVSEKVEIHELRAPALFDRTVGRQLAIYELDGLEVSELERISHLLDLRGLWGERAGLSRIQKLAYLREECGSQLHAVLIDVIRSPHIRARLSDIVMHFESIEGGMRKNA